MARSIFNDTFLRLPPATAVLLLSAAFGLSNGYALPRQTSTVAFHELNVVPFPPAPTEAPISLRELLRRQSDNTICGYIGGNSDIPATCSAGSHCVLDQDHGVVGCCPNGVTCTTGIFTGCVDWGSGAQTEVNPYVYTCQGSDVCYRNQFAGGFYQFGCGASTDMGTIVQTSIDGASSLVLEETSVPLTATPSSLSEPTTVGSSPTSTIGSSTGSVSTGSVTSATSSASSTGSLSSESSSTSSSTGSSSSTASTSESTSSSASTSSSSSSSTSSSSTTSTSRTSSTTTTSTSSTSSDSTAADATSSSTATAAPATNSNADNDNTGAIVGGSVSGAAVLVAIIAAALYLRKRNNDRHGPGPKPPAPPTTEYISPIKSHGAAFAPLPGWHEEDQQRGRQSPPSPYDQPGYPHQPWQAVTNPSPAHGYTQPLRYHPANSMNGAGIVGTGLAPVAEEQYDGSISSHGGGNELDEFARAYSSAGIGQQDDDRQPLTVMNPDEQLSSGSASRSESPGARSPSGRRGSRPLWQQNRQQTRNLMWL
ncbi:hypothetical protein F5B20DRAFT_179565 [Whalleya microplaca]|nr:hypothetical protein F5B20DRAFT_179565 [Whalleya microplaca]